MKKKTRLLGFITVIFALFILGSACSSTTSESGVDSTETGSASTTSEQPAEEKKPDVPAEYLSALVKAESYANNMNMSKKGVYDQLNSDYGEQFSEKAAQYAIDHVEADWKANALAKARSYQDDMSMSPKAIHDQLTSDYGEKFTKKQADYAIKHLND